MPSRSAAPTSEPVSAIASTYRKSSHESMCSRLPGALQRCQHARTDSGKASAIWSYDSRFGDQSSLISNRKMLFEELHGQRRRAVRLRLGVGLAAVAREGVVGAGIFVDGHQRVG